MAENETEMNADVTNEQMENDEKKTGEKKKRTRVVSEIWKHFTRIPDGDPDHPRAKCNYCGTTYAAHPKNSGTSSMKHHYEMLCTKNPNRVTKQKLLSFEPKKEGDGAPNLIDVSYDKEACRKSVAKYIVLEEL